MSAVVKLSTKLPGDAETNGLDAQAPRLIEHPDELLCAVVWIDAQKITEDTDAGTRVPTARIRRIEPIGDVNDVPAAVRDVVQAAVQKRTGRTPIPFEDAEVGDDPDQATIDEG